MQFLLVLMGTGALPTACATNPVTYRSAIIADADVAARRAVANEQAIDVAKIPARALAVMPFDLTQPDTLLDPLRFAMARILSVDLAVSPELNLVERVSIDAVLRELDMVDQGRIELATAPRLGRIVGARRLLLGDVTRSADNRLRLSARIVDVLGGTVQDLLVAEAPINQIIDAEKSLALLVFERLGITLTPAERERVERRQSMQLAALVAYGRGAQSDARGDAQGAIANYREAVRLDASFSDARRLAATPDAPTEARASSIDRVLELGVQSVNAPATVRNADVANAPLTARAAISLMILVRITP
jgi:TolB-like protein